MAKTLNKKSDNLNNAILKMLQENARISATDIGRSVGLSAPAVGERISKMEEEGIITGYRAQVNHAKLGLPIQAIITFKAVSISHTAFIKLIQSLKEIQECYIVTGNPGAIIKVNLESTLQLNDIIEKLKKYGETNTSVVLSKPVDLD
jgi:Lrp/AsnC family transcriptional regulator, leucine-responsive regulatory protein